MQVTTTWKSRGKTVRKVTMLDPGERVVHPLRFRINATAQTIGARFTVVAPDGTRATKVARTKVSRGG